MSLECSVFIGPVGFSRVVVQSGEVDLLKADFTEVTQNLSVISNFGLIITISGNSLVQIKYPDPTG